MNNITNSNGGKSEIQSIRQEDAEKSKKREAAEAGAVLPYAASVQGKMRNAVMFKSLLIVLNQIVIVGQVCPTYGLTGCSMIIMPACSTLLFIDI